MEQREILSETETTELYRLGLFAGYLTVILYVDGRFHPDESPHALLEITLAGQRSPAGLR